MDINNKKNSDSISFGHDQEIDAKVLFKVSPSLLAIIGTFVYSIVLFGISVFLILFRIEAFLPMDSIPIQITNRIPQLRIVMGVILASVVVLHIITKIIIVKLTSYLVTTDRIEWERGLIRRRIDNIDLFRIYDMQLHRTLLELILRIGTIKLFTSDRTDPEFALKDIRSPRRLYNVLKKASLDSDRRRGVVHFE